MAERKKWIVTTSGDRPLTEVRKKLTQSGFAVEQVLDAIGSITGSAPDDVVQRVRKLPGIADVSPDTSINLPPPDAPVSW